jgi:predicted transposase YbfD/YdcC
MEPILSILRQVRDPREENARHRLSDILFIALAATLCGAKTCVDIADFAEGHEEHLREWLDLPHGAPSHDTFSRVFRLLDPGELERVLIGFLSVMRQALGLGRPSGVVALDGKALRRGYDRGRAHVPPMMIGLWDTQTRMALAAGRIGLSESADAVDLLRSLSLKGCTITADALHCHPAMAEAIVAGKADYVLTLKGNNAPLRDLADETFRAAKDPPASQTTTAGHGRTERRSAIVITLAPRHPARRMLPGLKAFARLSAERRIDGQPATSLTRTFALSAPLAPRQLIDTVREHWGIENSMHWVLDVTFEEDRVRTRKDHAPENLAVIRRIALNILNAHPDKISPARKQRKANWSKDYFFQLFTHMR